MSPAVPKEQRMRDSRWFKDMVDLGPKLVLGTNIMLALELAVRNGIVGSLGRNSTLAFFMVGSFVIYIWTRPSWREIAGALAAAAILSIGYVRIWGGPDLSALDTAGSMLGAGSLAMLAIAALAGNGETRKAKAVTLGAACVLPFMWIVTALTLPLTTKLYPSAYDLYLYAFDASLGIQPSFSIGRMFQHFHWIQNTSEIAYYALPLDVSLLYAWHRTRDRQMPVNLLPLFLSTTAVGFTLYYLCPASGPVYAFPKLFPWTAPPLASLAIEPIAIADAARNAMPSLHFSAALLVFWNSIEWPKWARAFTAFFLLFTMLATMGFGEHYLIDLIVAVPFCLAMQGIWSVGLPWSATERRLAVAAGSVTVAIWLMLLRNATPVFRGSPAVAWTLVAATLALSLYLRHRLVRAVAGVPRI